MGSELNELIEDKLNYLTSPLFQMKKRISVKFACKGLYSFTKG